MKIESVWPNITVEKVIGQGSYGTVYKCVDNSKVTPVYYAVKVISVPQYEMVVNPFGENSTNEQTKEYYKEIVDDFLSEIKLLESLKDNKNVVHIEDSIVVEKENGIGWQIFIKMELLSEFSSFVSKGTPSVNDVVKFGLDMCNAIKDCARKKIIHRDIKPENIFVDDEGNFKLGDFGVAKQLERTEMSLSRKGTFNYMAPEVYFGRKYDTRADIYSLGMVMYTLLNNNRLPFLDPQKQFIPFSEREKAFKRRIDGEKIPPIQNVDEGLNDIILRACAFKKEDRFDSIEDFQKALEIYSSKGKFKFRKVEHWILNHKIVSVISFALIVAIISGVLVFHKASKDIMVFKRVGDVIELGSYPQTEVKDEEAKKELKKQLFGKSWTSYEYKCETEENKYLEEYMSYIDFSYKDEKYRAVKIGNLRPAYTDSDPVEKFSNLDENGYQGDNIYYFKFEKLEWYVISKEEGLLLCKTIIDSQPLNNLIYYTDGTEYYTSDSRNAFASNWRESTLRKWLNDDFYHTAFSTSDMEKIKEYQTDENYANETKYNSPPTKDNVFLLSKSDVFQNDIKKYMAAKYSDYSKCQGLYIKNKKEYARWSLRTPYDSLKYCHVGTTESVNVYAIPANNTSIGVRPAICFKDNVMNQDEFESEENKNTSTNPFSYAVASSALSMENDDGSLYYFNALKVLDETENTCWCEGVDGSGIGETLTVYSDDFHTIRHIIISNGFGKNEDAFYKNNRVKRIKITFDNVRSVEYDLPESYEKRFADIDIGYSLKCKKITFEIMSVYRGTDYDDTCISEIKIS